MTWEKQHSPKQETAKRRWYMNTTRLTLSWGRENNSLKDLFCEWNICSRSAYASVELFKSKYLPFVV
jgi:hypothetical protein